jgi:hypothetical protein
MTGLRDATVIKLSIQRMVCIGCGAEANASCNCGKPYVPKSVRAKEAIEAHPEKSDRAIAAELGVSPTTVGKARQLSSDGQLSDRTGLDGKTRRLPVRQEPDDAKATEADEEERDRKECIALFQKAKDAEGELKQWTADYAAKLTTSVAESPASWMIIAIAKDGKRYGNGVRLQDEIEADVYRMVHVMSDFWRAFREQHILVVATFAIPTDDEPNVSFERTKKGDITSRLLFQDGQCHLLGWHDIAAQQTATEEKDDLTFPPFLQLEPAAQP